MMEALKAIAMLVVALWGSWVLTREAFRVVRGVYRWIRKRVAPKATAKPPSGASQGRDTVTSAKAAPNDQPARTSQFADPAKRRHRAGRVNWRGSVEIAFTYENAEGDISTRTVTLKEADQTHLRGFCHLRGEQRTFRVDRILGPVVCAHTGEVVAADELLEAL